MTEQKKGDKKGLIRKLLTAKVSNIRFSDGSISFSFLGHKVSDKIVFKIEERVAEWSRRRKEIFIDREFGCPDMELSFRALCLHEAVEKFIAQKYHLDVDNEAHPVATEKEKEYLESNGGNWRRHEMLVYWDWHKQGEH